MIRFLIGSQRTLALFIHIVFIFGFTVFALETAHAEPVRDLAGVPLGPYWVQGGSDKLILPRPATELTVTSTNPSVVRFDASGYHAIAYFDAPGTAEIRAYSGSNLVASSTIEVRAADSIALVPWAVADAPWAADFHLLEGTTGELMLDVQGGGASLEGASPDTPLVAGGQAYIPSGYGFDYAVGEGLVAGDHPMQLQTNSGAYGTMTLHVHPRGDVSVTFQDVSAGRRERLVRVVLKLADGTEVFGARTTSLGGFGGPATNAAGDGYYYRPDASVTQNVSFYVGTELVQTTIHGTLVFVTEGRGCQVGAFGSSGGRFTLPGLVGLLVALVLIRRRH